jgi:glucose/arabinose dehydrogenase
MNSQALLCLAIVALVACNPTPPPGSSGKLSLVAVATDLEQPLYLTNTGTGNDLYIVEKTGKVKIFENASSTPRSLAFLDITSKISSEGERGLLSIAFHPKYAINGFVFVFYTNLDGNNTVSRFKANQLTKSVDLASEQVVLEIPHLEKNTNHNGGQLQFGQDGFLYISTGDGTNQDNAQNRQVLLGKMLRINIDSGTTYGIPDGNPFKVTGGAPEVWAFGLRNPWRFSFDRSTGDLWIGDVGQDRLEEINFTPKTSNAPQNYGWNITEATACYKPAINCDKTGISLPVREYTYGQGDRSVTGGFVYRGKLMPAFVGKYIYGDFVSGRIWSLTRSETGFVNALELDTDDNISSFGEDAEGELYVVALGGKVSRLVVK